MPKMRVGTQASQKDLLDGVGDLLGFNTGLVDPAYSSRSMTVNLTLQLTRREFICNLRWNKLVCAQTVPSVPLREQPFGKSDRIADSHRNRLLRTVKLVGSD